MEPGLHLHHSERLGGDLSSVQDRTLATWVAPRTWVAGETLTASLLNTHLRDQLLYLGGPDARAASPPGSPIDGQVWRYVADATNGVEWTFAYNSADASANKWHNLSGAYLRSEVATSETTASATYVDLTTVGPTLTLARAGDYTFHAHTDLTNASGGNTRTVAGIKNGGGATADLLETPNYGPGSPNFYRGSGLSSLAVAAAGVVKLQYAAPGGGTGTFLNRKLWARPTRVA